jgi:tungstate transport system substrate-binding protein
MPAAPYSFFVSNRYAESKLGAASILADWLVSVEGQLAIGAIQLNGQKLFNPSAASPK